MSLIKLAEQWEHYASLSPEHTSRTALLDCAHQLRSALTELSQADPDGLVAKFEAAIREHHSNCCGKEHPTKGILDLGLSCIATRNDVFAFLLLLREQRDSAVALIEAQEELTKAGWCCYLEDSKTLVGPDPVRLNRATEAEKAARLRYQQAMAAKEEA